MAKLDATEPCSVSLESRTYAVYNPMSSRVGTLRMAGRITCLGTGLLAHVPRLDVEQPIDNVPMNCAERLPTTTQPANQVEQLNELLNQPDRKIEELASRSGTSKELVANVKLTTVATQVSAVRGKPLGTSVANRDRSTDSLTILYQQPPALLYNNDADEQSISSVLNCGEQDLLKYEEQSIVENDVKVVPILMALLSEFRSLRKVGITGAEKNIIIHKPVSLAQQNHEKPFANVDKSNSMVSRSRNLKQKHTIAFRPKHKPFTIPVIQKTHPKHQIYESRNDFLRRISKPKYFSQPYIRETISKTPNMVRDDSKTRRLICGNTKSQRLRLAIIETKNKQREEETTDRKYIAARKPRPPNSRVPAQRKPVPTPRHSIVNLDDDCENTTDKEGKDNAYNEQTVTIDKSTPCDAFHFEVKLDQKVKNAHDLLNEATILKVIKEVIAERSKAKREIPEVLEDSVESYSEDEDISETISNLSDLQLYQQTYSDSSVALTISDPEVFIINFRINILILILLIIGNCYKA